MLRSKLTVLIANLLLTVVLAGPAGSTVVCAKLDCAMLIERVSRAAAIKMVFIMLVS